MNLSSPKPCLWFNDQAEAAANFYISVLGGSIGDISRYTLEEEAMRNPVLLPKRAQFAVQAGLHLADQLPALLKGEAPVDQKNFRPFDLGYLITLGPHDGIGRIGPQPQSRLARWASPFIQGTAVDKLKNLVRVRYMLTLKREAYNPFQP